MKVEWSAFDFSDTKQNKQQLSYIIVGETQVYVANNKTVNWFLPILFVCVQTKQKTVDCPIIRKRKDERRYERKERNKRTMRTIIEREKQHRQPHYTKPRIPACANNAGKQLTNNSEKKREQRSKIKTLNWCRVCT